MGIVLRLDDADRERRKLARDGKEVVFANGVFDLLHRGHVEYLARARELGDALFVGLNTDASTRRLKGASRPYVTATDRAVVVAALESVDVVVIFDEDTPEELIRRLAPDVLVKGDDYSLEEIVGREHVESSGGRVERVAMVPGCSTTELANRIAGKLQDSNQGQEGE